MKKLLRTLKGEEFETPPIWFMRQAGRYLEEYQEIRRKEKSFLELCYSPKLASEITLQPIKRFGFDGAILFSDILVIPDALGLKVEFVKNEGPKLEKITTNSKLSNLKTSNIEKHLMPVFETIDITKSNLDKKTTLIGFSGSPWTIATYMIEGGGSKKFETIRRMAVNHPEFFENLITILIESITIYLSKQIEAGVEVVKLFDSWAGVLCESEFKKWVINPHKKIISNLKSIYPEIPIITFPRGAGVMYEDFIGEVESDAVAIDQHISRSWAKDILQEKHKKIIQGNLDNIILSSNSIDLELEVVDIMKNFNDKPFIFNLGHGILPDTPIENVQKVINMVRNFS